MTDGRMKSDGVATRRRLIDADALGDLIAVLATLVIVKQSLLPWSTLYAGPASTFSAMLVATVLLKRRGSSWKDLGLRRPDSWLRTAGLTILTIFAIALSMELMEVVADRYFEDQGASGRFDHVEGDLVAYLIVLVLVWTHASFFEELLFRAFIISKTSDTLGGGLRPDLIAVVFSAVFFGYRHVYYQGMHGGLQTGAAGLTLALLYLWFGRRSIMPLVLAHGVVNSIGMTVRYLGVSD